jgi:hypothetical protein
MKAEHFIISISLTRKLKCIENLLFHVIIVVGSGGYAQNVN